MKELLVLHKAIMVIVHKMHTTVRSTKHIRSTILTIFETHTNLLSNYILDPLSCAHMSRLARCVRAPSNCFIKHLGLEPAMIQQFQNHYEEDVGVVRMKILQAWFEGGHGDVEELRLKVLELKQSFKQPLKQELQWCMCYTKI